jgi:hypothetical protein
MAENRYVNTHPSWQDWLAAGLGSAVVVSPHLTGDAISTTVEATTTFAGLLIVLVAFVERLQVRSGTEERAREWEGVLLSLFGAMIAMQPFIFGYAGAGTLRYIHFALGGSIFLLAMLELRRDYVADMKKHGWWKHP